MRLTVSEKCQSVASRDTALIRRSDPRRRAPGWSFNRATPESQDTTGSNPVSLGEIYALFSTAEKETAARILHDQAAVTMADLSEKPTTTIIEALEELYSCASCTAAIPPHRARVSCHSCPSHHLCANCQVIKNFVPPHSAVHSTMVFKHSGLTFAPPAGFAPRPGPAPPLPPRAAPSRTPSLLQIAETPASVTVPTANWGALWNVLKAPLEKREKRAAKRDSVDEAWEGKPREVGRRSETSLVASSQEADLPLSPPGSRRSTLETVGSAAPAPQYPVPESWTAFFEKDYTPTPIFVALMSTLFSRLDPEQTGFLSPENYSAFLEVQGVEFGANIWKCAMAKASGEHRKNLADLELSLYISNLLIYHTLNVRPDPYDPSKSPDEVEKPHSAALGEGPARDSRRFSANMPMISRQCFIDVCAVEYLKDPSKAYGWLRNAVTAYGVWEGLGEMPREVLPETKIPRLLQTELKTENVEAGSVNPEIKVEKEKEELGAIEDTENAAGKIENESMREPTETALPVSPQTLTSPFTHPVMPLRLKGGEKKVEALMHDEEFDESTAVAAENADSNRRETDDPRASSLSSDEEMDKPAETPEVKITDAAER
ncbi:hypothetical protein PZA11_002955 [Diplocarpon coronariae]